jgi:hypothetical protein
MIIWLPDGMPLSRLWKPILLLVALGVAGLLMNRFDYMERYYLLFAFGGIVVAIWVAVLTSIEVSNFMRNEEESNE